MSRKRFFQYVGKTPIIPISGKILLIFISLILLSNFMTNLISIQLTQTQVFNLTNTLLMNQMKELYTNAGNQYQIYAYSKDREKCIEALSYSASSDFSQEHSLALGFDRTGKILFFASGASEYESFKPDAFYDSAALALMNRKYSAGVMEDTVVFTLPEGEYFGIYKYSDDWNAYLVRAEFRPESKEYTVRVFGIISAIIIVLTAIFVFIGIFMFRRVFSSISRITNSLYDMQSRQSLEVINIDDSPNDDVTYLAASFNSLSVSVNNLLKTFQKFVSKDIVSKAYADHTINLEGTQRELTILFSDIKSFTYRTETLGNEIIDLLNVHYNSVIHSVHEKQGVIGSIIGDAILAIFGTQTPGSIKSVEAIDSAWEITYVTAELREKMKAHRLEIEQRRRLTDAEERVYNAVLIDIGVGIDGGTVFYGNIGSDEHMTNTVIGDNVNSASRLEGVTRIYNLPVIVSEYIKNEAEENTDRYKFYEIDTVQVKGKTTGKKIFYPLDLYKAGASELSEKFEIFEQGLACYYKGNWKDARKHFKKSELDVCEVFLERMGLKSAPAKWSGIWEMTTK